MIEVQIHVAGLGVVASSRAGAPVVIGGETYQWSHTVQAETLNETQRSIDPWGGRVVTGAASVRMVLDDYWAGILFPDDFAVPQARVGAHILPADTMLEVDDSGPFSPGDILHYGRESFRVVSTPSAGTIEVERGVYQSHVWAHRRGGIIATLPMALRGRLVRIYVDGAIWDTGILETTEVEAGCGLWTLGVSGLTTLMGGTVGRVDWSATLRALPAGRRYWAYPPSWIQNGVTTTGSPAMYPPGWRTIDGLQHILENMPGSILYSVSAGLHGGKLRIYAKVHSPGDQIQFGGHGWWDMYGVPQGDIVTMDVVEGDNFGREIELECPAVALLPFATEAQYEADARSVYDGSTGVVTRQQLEIPAQGPLFADDGERIPLAIASGEDGVPRYIQEGAPTGELHLYSGRSWSTDFVHVADEIPVSVAIATHGLPLLGPSPSVDHFCSWPSLVYQLLTIADPIGYGLGIPSELVAPPPASLPWLPHAEVDVRKPTGLEEVIAPWLKCAQSIIIEDGGQLRIRQIDPNAPPVFHLTPQNSRLDGVAITRDEERLISQVVITRDLPFNSETIAVNLMESSTTWSGTQPLEIDASSLRIMRLADLAELVTSRLFVWFSRPYLTMSVECVDPASWDIREGDTVDLTAPFIPAPGGSRGVSRLRCLVTSRQRSVSGRVCTRLGLVSPQYSGAITSGYARTLTLTGYSAGWHAHTGEGVEYFAVGEVVEVYAQGQHDTTAVSATIVGLSSTQVELSPDPGAGVAPGYVVDYAQPLGDALWIFLGQRRVWV